jgi:hypothetical protein
VTQHTFRARGIELDILLEVSLGSAIGQLRAMPVRLGEGAPKAFLAVYCADFDDDPYIEMFFFPTDTLKMALFTEHGQILWRCDLGKGVVPGIWFCPVFAFDLDGDGVDEIWYVNNVNVDHPLGLSGYRLARIDAQNGACTGQWPWPNQGGRQNLSHTFRNFIFGGHANGEPVLVTAQGTYGDMLLQGWGSNVSQRWERRIGEEDAGARGSHMCAIADMDQDGVQQVLWGERCIELGAGRELFCADRDTYRGHSDIAQPILDRESEQWFVYTCRESEQQVSPRVVLYDSKGERIWGAVDAGHIDMGWVARLGDDGQLVASAIRIGQKTCGPDGRFHTGMDEFAFDALTGEPTDLGFSTYGTIPVDLNGDGRHELVRGRASRDGEVLDRHGNLIGDIGAPVAMASKFLDRPGEQLLAYYPDGVVRVWADRNAQDSPDALARYARPLYEANQRLTGVGYNLPNLGGM